MANPRSRSSANLPNDLVTDLLDDLCWWTDEETKDSLNRIYEHAQRISKESVIWYIKAKNRKRRWARLLRFFAVCAVGTAGVVPVLAMILENSKSALAFNSAWASVLFGVAGLLVGVDKFFGLSSAWSRYADAELQIQAMRHRFELEWQIGKASLCGDEPACEEVIEMLKKAKRFVAEVDNVIKRETDQWAAEFQQAMRRMDESTQTVDREGS